MRARVSVLGLVLLSVLCLPLAADAKKKHKGGVTECQRRVADRIQSDHPPSRGSSFDSAVDRRAYGDNAVTISGRGRVRTQKGKNRSFTYSCVFNHRNGKLSQVKYNIK